ncbi:MAG: hypothetical protein U0790_08065 [Isosphaeraceae bacterium]
MLAVLWVPGFGVTPGGRGRPRASGRVTYNDRPVTNGAIIFEPINRNSDWGASQLDPEGNFALETFAGRDELPPGKYRVFFVFHGKSSRGLKDLTKRHEEEPADEGLEAPLAGEVPPPIPAKYTRSLTSDLWVVLTKEPNRIDIRLKD